MASGVAVPATHQHRLGWGKVAVIATGVAALLSTTAFALTAYVLLARTDFLERFADRLPFDVPVAEFNMTYKRTAGSLARADAHIRPGALLFVGDSIIRDLDTSSLARHTVNLAIGGDTTSRVYHEMAGYQSLKTARGVVLGAGINDQYYRPVPEALRMYRKILRLVPKETPVIVSAVLPIDPTVIADLDNARVRQMNAGLRELCATRPGCRFVDAGAAMADEQGNLKPSMHDGGGIHLSDVGGELFWKAFNSAVHDHMPAARVILPDGTSDWVR